MTIENVLEILEKHKLHIPSNVFYELKADIVNFEEPTTKNDLGVDAVSRQAVLELIADYDLSMGQVVKGIHALPSVTPQERKGHWIDINDDGFLYHRIYKCSHCGDTVCDYPENIQKYKYCHNCGAKMVEPQESEET